MKSKKLTEADVTAESVFMLQRRQILKMLGLSATALSLSRRKIRYQATTTFMSSAWIKPIRRPMPEACALIPGR